MPREWEKQRPTKGWYGATPGGNHSLSFTPVSWSPAHKTAPSGLFQLGDNARCLFQQAQYSVGHLAGPGTKARTARSRTVETSGCHITSHPCTTSPLCRKYSPPLSFLRASPLLLCSSTYWGFPPSALFPVPETPKALGQCHSLFSLLHFCMQSYISDRALPTSPHTFSLWWGACTWEMQGGCEPGLAHLSQLPASSSAARMFGPGVTWEIGQHTHWVLIWANNDKNSAFAPNRWSHQWKCLVHF